MDRNQILVALSKIYDGIYNEYQGLSELAKELLHDGEDQAYQSIVRRAQSKSNMLDGIRLAAAALDINLDELLQTIAHKEAHT